MSDRMMMDLWTKENVDVYELVEDEKMCRERRMLLELTNWQRNIYLCQPMEVMSMLI